MACMSLVIYGVFTMLHVLLLECNHVVATYLVWLPMIRRVRSKVLTDVDILHWHLPLLPSGTVCNNEEPPIHSLLSDGQYIT